MEEAKACQKRTGPSVDEQRMSGGLHSDEEKDKETNPFMFEAKKPLSMPYAPNKPALSKTGKKRQIDATAQCCQKDQGNQEAQGIDCHCPGHRVGRSQQF